MQWHPFALTYPEISGEEWQTFLESIKKTGGNQIPITYRMNNGVEEGLDGRNRLRACEVLGLPPYLQRVELADDAVVDFIRVRNDHRRHVSAELRREQAANLYYEGLSTRQIAQQLGSSQSTIHRDLGRVIPESEPEGEQEEESREEKPRVPHRSKNPNAVWNWNKFHEIEKKLYAMVAGLCQSSRMVGSPEERALGRLLDGFFDALKKFYRKFKDEEK